MPVQEHADMFWLLHVFSGRENLRGENENSTQSLCPSNLPPAPLVVLRNQEVLFLPYDLWQSLSSHHRASTGKNIAEASPQQ